MKLNNFNYEEVSSEKGNNFNICYIWAVEFLLYPF